VTPRLWRNSQAVRPIKPRCGRDLEGAHTLSSLRRCFAPGTVRQTSQPCLLQHPLTRQAKQTTSQFSFTGTPPSTAQPAFLGKTLAQYTDTLRLWGNPEHLKYVSTSLREKFPEESLAILVAKRNAGSFTYDGVDTGGERVASEVEQKLEELAKDGHDIKKISFIGYSLGGLVARFAIGLLYSRGVFEEIRPVV
jgi:hypothetical protein